MEDTVDINSSLSYNGQFFRVSYKGRDYQFQILQKNLTKEEISIKILLDGVIQQLELKQDLWQFNDSDQDQSLAYEIWRAISLRYRI